MHAGGIIQAGPAEYLYGMPCIAAVGDSVDSDKRRDATGMRTPG